jgi:hypothetical protein
MIALFAPVADVLIAYSRHRATPLSGGFTAIALCGMFMRKILIVDYTTHHPEVVSALIELFKGHTLRLAITESFYNKYVVRGDHFNVEDLLVKKEKVSNRDWLQSLGELFLTQDIIIFSTPIKNRLLQQTLELDTSAREVLFLHNVNYFLGTDLLDFSTFVRLLHAGRPGFSSFIAFCKAMIKQRRKQLRLWMQGASFSELDRHIDFYCFGSNGVENYFRERSGRINTAILPTNIKRRSASETFEPPVYRGVLHLAIIGIVSPTRKDYVPVLKAMLQAKWSRPVILSLLGGCPDPVYAQELAALIRTNDNPSLEVRFDPSQTYIPAEELSRLLDDVHILLSPIQPDIAYQLHREVYGLSKVSGSEGDGLAYKRPLLLPKSYCCADYIEPLAVHYADTDELIAKINALNDESALQLLYRRVTEVVVDDRCEAFATAFLQRVNAI